MSKNACREFRKELHVDEPKDKYIDEDGLKNIKQILIKKIPVLNS